LKHRSALPSIDTGNPSMHTSLLPLEQPSTWLITLAYIVALVFVSRAIEKRTGRAGAPAPGRKRIAYIAFVAAGAVGSVVWLEHLLHRGASPVLVCMAWGVWSLLAQGFFGRPTGR
jgi:hypothetical protein